MVLPSHHAHVHRQHNHPTCTTHPSLKLKQDQAWSWSAGNNNLNMTTLLGVLLNAHNTPRITAGRFSELPLPLRVLSD